MLKKILTACVFLKIAAFDVQGFDDFSIEECPVKNLVATSGTSSCIAILNTAKTQRDPYGKAWILITNGEQGTAAVYCYKDHMNSGYALCTDFNMCTEKGRQKLLEYTHEHIEPRIFESPLQGKSPPNFIVYDAHFSWQINSNDYVPEINDPWSYRILGFKDICNLYWLRSRNDCNERYDPYLWSDETINHFRAISSLLKKCQLHMGENGEMKLYRSIFIAQDRRGELAELAQSTVSLLDSLAPDRLPDRFSYVNIAHMILPIVWDERDRFDNDIQLSIERINTFFGNNFMKGDRYMNMFDTPQKTPFDHLFYGNLPKPLTLNE